VTKMPEAGAASGLDGHIAGEHHASVGRSLCSARHHAAVDTQG
jgi:hypothetical protein